MKLAGGDSSLLLLCSCYYFYFYFGLITYYTYLCYSNTKALHALLRTLTYTTVLVWM